MHHSQVVERKLQVKYGTYGPSHDPYSFTECTMITKYADGQVVKAFAHNGLNAYVKLNDVRIGADDEAFELIFGMSPPKFKQIHDRLHPYFDDPIKGWQ
jgi:hypothetical protein